MQIPSDGDPIAACARLSVVLVYEPECNHPVALAWIGSKTMIFEVAEAAIREAERRAAMFEKGDDVLGLLEREEADRLKRVLGSLVPELRFNAAQGQL